MADAGNACIFLDLRCDRYLALAGRQALWLKEIRTRSIDGNISLDARHLASSLIRRGILTPDEASGKPICPLDHCAPERSALDAGTSCIDLRLRDTRLFLKTLIETAALRRRSRRDFRKLIHAAAGWKSDLAPSDAATPEEACILARRFDATASMFIARKDTCLLRSLLLARYLTSKNIRTDWVFAVRTAPFAAHCWIEAGGILMNETCDRAREYVPIMRI